MARRLSASARQSSKFIKLDMMRITTYYYARDVMCQCGRARLVVLRFPKVSGIRRQWMFVVKRVTMENKAWIRSAKPNDYDVVCQRHLTDSD